MRIWSVRFFPRGQGVHHELRFRTDEAAEAAFERATAHKVGAGRITLESDWNIKIHLNPGEFDIIKVDTESAAGEQVALQEAAHDAARLYGIAVDPTRDPGSTIQ